ncbi:unnamed protein product [Pleuronectes platessa]|uniref:Uncharacterized protein n=1 Tax=Pleuronectes platessa TaxID=8262 RepID=A0A9N7ZCQ8_PLEPL|nr:unnamed protein product [Pleuronectes platessa]
MTFSDTAATRSAPLAGTEGERPVSRRPGRAPCLGVDWMEWIRGALEDWGGRIPPARQPMSHQASQTSRQPTLAVSQFTICVVNLFLFLKSANAYLCWGGTSG